jgi:hypothetical protein
MISAHIVNEKFRASDEELSKRGFVKKQDDTGSPWGMWWELQAPKFWVTIDPTNVFHLLRKDPDSDHITIVIDDLYDLDTLVDWVQEG